MMRDGDDGDWRMCSIFIVTIVTASPERKTTAGKPSLK